METCTEFTAANSFTLTFNKLTTVNLVRQGLREKPISTDKIRSIIIRPEDYVKKKMEIYKQGLRRENVKRKDFILDDKGQILTNLSSGLSTCTSEEELAKRLVIDQRCLWEIPTGTPFPSEMIIVLNPKTGHASIKPASGVSLEIFVKMLNCLHWVKVHP